MPCDATRLSQRFLCGALSLLTTMHRPTDAPLKLASLRVASCSIELKGDFPSKTPRGHNRVGGGIMFVINLRIKRGNGRSLEPIIPSDVVCRNDLSK